MGITGLLPFLKDASQNVHLSVFNGTTAAIDTYSWIHKGAYACSEELYKNEDTDIFVNYCTNKIALLREHNIEPILVFDGRTLPAKHFTEKSRLEKREKQTKKIKHLLNIGKENEARDLMKSSIEITQEIAKKVIEACRRKGISYINAPYEADAQLAHLVNKNIAHFVITEDSDLILFGCKYVYTKLDRDGNGVLIRQDLIQNCLGPKSYRFDFITFRRMCILSGCDYLPSLPGIGLKKAQTFFGLTENRDLQTLLHKVPSYLNIKKLSITKEYVKGFINAERTYKHQVIFDPKERKLMPLTPYNNELCQSDVSFAGEFFDDSIAFQFALGNVDHESLEINDSYELKFKSILWSNHYKILENNPLDKIFEIQKKRSLSNSSNQNTSYKRARLFNSQEDITSEVKENNLSSPISNISIQKPVKDTKIIFKTEIISPYFSSPLSNHKDQNLRDISLIAKCNNTPDNEIENTENIHDNKPKIPFEDLLKQRTLRIKQISLLYGRNMPEIKNHKSHHSSSQDSGFEEDPTV